LSPIVRASFHRQSNAEHLAGALERSGSSRERVRRVSVPLRAHGANVDLRSVEGLGHEILVHGYEEIRLNMAWLPPIGGRFALRTRPSPVDPPLQLQMWPVGAGPPARAPLYFFILSPLWPPARLRRALSRRWRFGHMHWSPFTFFHDRVAQEMSADFLTRRMHVRISRRGLL
jgi:hypothetical protein